MAPQYPNLFMANLEEKFLQSTHIKPLLYLRYIDEIFLLRTLGEELLRFYKNIYSEDQDINITISSEEVNFLDTALRLKSNTLHTSLLGVPEVAHHFSFIKSFNFYQT